MNTLPVLERSDSSCAVHAVSPFPKAKPWQCSVYYFWWRFLKEHEGYRECCENGGEGPHAETYRDFGDIRGNDFRSWWKKSGRHLFTVLPPEKYQVLGKPNVTVLHRRHRLLVLVKTYPDAPLWKLFDISEGRSNWRALSPLERNQKALIARRYYQEARSIVAFAALGLFPVRSTSQFRRIAGVQSSIALQEHRTCALGHSKQTDA